MNKNSNPSIIARETLRQLAMLKMAPTPDNYQKLYDEMAETPASYMHTSTVKALTELANEFPRNTPELVTCANQLESATNERNWEKYHATLINFIKHTALSTKPIEKSTETTPKANAAWGETISLLLKQLDINNGSLTIAKKREGLNRVLSRFSAEPTKLHDKLSSLIDSWALAPTITQESLAPTITQENSTETISELSPSTSSIDAITASTSTATSTKKPAIIIPNQLQELLVQILQQITAQPLNNHQLIEEANTLATQVSLIDSEDRLTQFINGTKEFSNKLVSHGKNNTQLQKRLLQLFNLLMDRTSELLSGDKWLQDKLALLRNTLSNNIDLQAIDQAEYYLKEIVTKQITVKQSLEETKTTLKRMVTSLINNIEELSDSTGNYHNKIEHYAETINQTEDISTLSQLVMDIASETKKMQADVLNSRNDFLAARTEVDIAQNKIHELESELQQMGEQAHEDHLTGILNRRGLDNAFKRELEHSKELHTSICLALIDIDNFKKFNDTHGHKVGDDVLVYLAETMKETTRPEDIVARFGGEEFVILLPDTEINEAVSIVSRVRRNLTKHFFLHQNNRLLITFSAGVAEHQLGETQENILVRADKALYQAKNNGKNQVIAAAAPPS